MRLPARNDIPGAVGYLVSKLDAGTWRPDDSEICLMLQDNPDKFAAEFARTCKARRAAGKPVPPEDPDD